MFIKKKMGRLVRFDGESGKLYSGWLDQDSKNSIQDVMDYCCPRWQQHIKIEVVQQLVGVSEIHKSTNIQTGKIFKTVIYPSEVDIRSAKNLIC